MNSASVHHVTGHIFTCKQFPCRSSKKPKPKRDRVQIATSALESQDEEPSARNELALIQPGFKLTGVEV